MLTYALDDLVAQFDLPHPTHIKLDVDGSELAVLEGARAILRRPSLSSIMLEIEEGERERVQSLLEESGLHLCARYDRPPKAARKPKPDWSYHYALFTRDAAAG